MADALVIRPAGFDELDDIVALAGRALGWRPDEPNRELFEWKHRHNPFGPSGLWVAEDGGELVGLRALMRWEFRRPDGSIARAVRPVDTATHPDHQGRGIFRRLTEHAIAAEKEAGVSFVFNTPNDQSRPGYLKMGWQVAGKVPTSFRPLRTRAVWRMVQARQPAAKWSLPDSPGLDPTACLTDEVAARFGPRTPDAVITNRTGPFLRWRYGLTPLHYRVLEANGALVIFRRRQRGPAIELVVADVLATERSAAAAALRRARSVDADYLLSAGEALPGLVPMPGQGPVLTTRDLADSAPAFDDLALRLGDIELF